MTNSDAPICNKPSKTWQKAGEAQTRLDSWLASACHSTAAVIRELSKKVRGHKDAIVRAVALGISNACVEAINNKIKLTACMGYGFRTIGFRTIDNLIVPVTLHCPNLPITLPERA